MHINMQIIDALNIQYYIIYLSIYIGIHNILLGKSKLHAHNSN